ncbi:SDR family oxidoreductase [Arthrobacter sp. 2RAF6]|uniref:SDR family oxidoreductase n=1 Tax=Arthrobacter sp. 2RAF6 TaxID=3233002 RepID=UPI003F8D9793
MILVTGGTGTLGSALVNQLVAGRYPVRVLTRHAELAPALNARGVEAIGGTVENQEDADRATRGCSTVISAMSGFGPQSGSSPDRVDLGGNRNLLVAARRSGTEHFIMVSMHGAAENHPLQLARLKYEFERELMSAPLAWTIVRPTVLTETFAAVIGAPMRKAGVAVIFGDGQQKINFVSVHDVAAVLVQALSDPALRGKAIDMGGPENLTINEFVAALRSRYGSSGATVHIPRAVLRLVTRWPALTPDSIGRTLESALHLADTGHSLDALPARSAVPDVPLTTVSQAFALL